MNNEMVTEEIPPIPQQEKQFLPKKRKQLRSSYKNCFYCQVALTKKTFSVDHVVPRDHGGSSKPKNLVPACISCNCLKSNRKSFILLEWKSIDKQPQLKFNQVVEICTIVEKVHLFQSIQAYLLLNQDHKAFLVLNAFMKDRDSNSQANIRFLNQLKNFNKTKVNDKKQMFDRINSILNSADNKLRPYQKELENADFKYLIEGEIYSDIPYFNLAAI